MPVQDFHIDDIPAGKAGQRILRLTGPLLLPSIFEFQSMVRADTSRSLILDLTEVPYIDSAGIGALVGANVTHQKDGRSLALVGVNERVRNALKITRVDQFFQYHRTVADAEQAAG